MHNKKFITGIQQIGVGVENVHEAWTWYRKNFGMDVKVFEESAVAELMLPYTDGQKRARHAVLALNMQGGGGFEVWQHTGKVPKLPDFQIEIGDIGIFSTKIKTASISQFYNTLKENEVELLSEIQKSPDGKQQFWIKDPFNNIFQAVESDEVFMQTETHNGGVFGAIIGVSDIEKSLSVYQDILEYEQIIYDITGEFQDFSQIPGGNGKFRRVLLAHPRPRTGGFSPMLGSTQIELIQRLDKTPNKIFKDRIWGDPGFIHICFDVIGIHKLREECISKGFPFTVDSANSFDMGEAAGHFVYISDPDGTPVEFVETHRLPIIKKIGWYMNLQGRNPLKSLPLWMIKTLKWKRIKDKK
jgi:catechol 2,3-dioxygenase-like lactoylglutathione lyase family enzyme